jgi:hypothetical protein
MVRKQITRKIKRGELVALRDGGRLKKVSTGVLPVQFATGFDSVFNLPCGQKGLRKASVKS